MTRKNDYRRINNKGILYEIEVYSYVNGMSAAIYFFASVICGLQLCFGIFRPGTASNDVLSRTLGTILLLMSCSTACYVLSGIIVVRGSMLVLTASTIDFIIFAGLSCLGNIIYANNQPRVRSLVLYSLPFVITTFVNAIFPSARTFLLDIAVLMVIAEYIHFVFLIRKYERTLEDLYSDPYSHSLKWMWGITALFAGWWILRLVFLQDELVVWYDLVIYIYLTGLVVFAYCKVSSYGEPVSPQTQEQIENFGLSTSCPEPQLLLPIQTALVQLLSEQQLYMNPNLSVEDLAVKLKVAPQLISVVLHNNLSTTFSQIVNQYRVEKAKELLSSSDVKVSGVYLSCGFNSQQVFNRTFFKFTGKTPSEWRNSLN